MVWYVTGIRTDGKFSQLLARLMRAAFDVSAFYRWPQADGTSLEDHLVRLRDALAEWGTAVAEWNDANRTH